MKKNFYIIITIICSLTLSIYMYEYGIYHFIKLEGKILVEERIDKIVIKDNGNIYTYKNNINNITSKKFNKLSYPDLKKLKKYINNLDGEFEIITKTNPQNNKIIYIYRNNEKIKIKDEFGQNNSETSKKILKIIYKYL